MDHLKDRQKEVLGMIVDTYVETVSPVGSQTIARCYRNTLSPATIRNEMQELEELDYITHPHTSAGRVPTDKGYRYYVDHLMAPKVRECDIKLITQEYQDPTENMEKLVERTSKILSLVSEQVSFVICSGEELAFQRVALTGLANILGQPEFHDWEKSKRLFQTLDAKEIFFNLTRPMIHEKGPRIYIGEEHRCRDIWDCSIVTSEYWVGEKQVGVLGILGPRRMPYARMVSLVDYVADRFEEMLEQWL